MAELVTMVPKTYLNACVKTDWQWLYVIEGKKTMKVDLSSLAHVAVSYGGLDYRFRLTSNNKQFLEFAVTKKEGHAQKLFSFLESFCKGFDSSTAPFIPYTGKGFMDHQIQIDQETLTEYSPKFFGKGMKLEKRIPVKHFTHVAQHHSITEDEEHFYLYIFSLDGQSVCLEGDSIQDCYEMAQKIKGIAPQIQYRMHTR